MIVFTYKKYVRGEDIIKFLKNRKYKLATFRRFLIWNHLEHKDFPERFLRLRFAYKTEWEKEVIGAGVRRFYKDFKNKKDVDVYDAYSYFQHWGNEENKKLYYYRDVEVMRRILDKEIKERYDLY